MKVTQIGKYYEVRADEGYTLIGDGAEGEIRILPTSININKLIEVIKVETVEEVIAESENNPFLEEAKKSKIEEIRNRCNEAINNGFYSYCYKDIKKLYACEKEDQINIQSLHQMAIAKEAIDTKISMGISLTLTEKSIKSEILRYKAKGETCYNDFTVDEVKTLMYDMNKHVTSNLNRFNELRIQILKAENESDIYYIEF